MRRQGCVQFHGTMFGFYPIRDARFMARSVSSLSSSVTNAGSTVLPVPLSDETSTGIHPYGSPTPHTTTQVPSPASFRGGRSACGLKPSVGGKAQRGLVRIQIEKRREQGRRNQARYRRKQIQAAEELDISVQQLKLQVFQLEDRQLAIRSAIATRTQTCARVATEFLQLFHYELGESEGPQELLTAYVRCYFCPQVRAGGHYGRDFLLSQAHCFSVFFSNVKVEWVRCVDSTTSHGSTIIHTAHQLDLTVSSATLHHVFPRLLHQEYGQIRTKLNGKQIELYVCTVFVFDESGAVTAVDLSIDFAHALQRVLTIRDTAIVLETARIERGGYLLNQSPSGDIFRSEDCAREDPRYFLATTWGQGDESAVV